MGVVLPSFNSMPQIDAAIEIGRSVVGSVLGQNFAVYRLGPTSSGQVVQESNQVRFGTPRNLFPCKMEINTKKTNIEVAWVIRVPLFIGKCDARFLEVGDVLVDPSLIGSPQYGSDGSVFTFAGRRPPTNEAIFVWTPLACTFTRPENNPTQIRQGRVPYEGHIKEAEMSLVLWNGSYYWAIGGMLQTPGGVIPVTPSTLWVGLHPEPRQTGMRPPDERLPGEVKEQRWLFYTNPPVGQELDVNDVLNGTNGDRYSTTMVYPQVAGTQGLQGVAQRQLV